MADTKQNIEVYKQKFQHSLVGKWITIEGTFFMSTDTFEFYPNGKGIWLQESGSGDYLTYFDWKITEPFVLQLLETKTVYPDNNETQESEEAQEEDEMKWQTINYDFKVILNDCGQAIALCNKDSEHFYYASNRVGFSNSN